MGERIHDSLVDRALGDASVEALTRSHRRRTACPEDTHKYLSKQPKTLRRTRSLVERAVFLYPVSTEVPRQLGPRRQLRVFLQHMNMLISLTLTPKCIPGPLIYYALSGCIDVQQVVNTVLRTMVYSLEMKVNRRPGDRPVASEETTHDEW